MTKRQMGFRTGRRINGTKSNTTLRMLMPKNLRSFGRILCILFFTICLSFQLFVAFLEYPNHVIENLITGKWLYHTGQQNSTFESEFSFVKIKTRSFEANSSCVIVGCSTFNAPGGEYFWNFYTSTGYSVMHLSFETILLNGKKVKPHWCRIPTIIRALKLYPTSRVAYSDIDTRLMDSKTWCDMPHLGAQAPIVMASLHRSQPVKTEHFTIHGSQVQTNSFVVAPGRTGLEAMRRWQRSYGNFHYFDQGAIHYIENGLCGVPGWIQCFSNPAQQNCHCTGSKTGKTKSGKERCIKRLFDGTLDGCIVNKTSLS